MPSRGKRGHKYAPMILIKLFYPEGFTDVQIKIPTDHFPQTFGTIALEDAPVRLGRKDHVWPKMGNLRPTDGQIDNPNPPGIRPLADGCRFKVFGLLKAVCPVIKNHDIVP